MGKMKNTLLVGLAGALLVSGATGCKKDPEKQQESNNAVVDKIKDLQTDGENKEFENLMVINIRTLESNTGLNENDVENAFGQLPTDVDSTFYLALKPLNGKADRVKKLVGLYIDSLKTRLESSLPMTIEGEEVSEEEQARRNEIQKKIDMLNNMLIEESKGYIIYVSSSDNAKVLSAIKKGL